MRVFIYILSFILIGCNVMEEEKPLGLVSLNGLEVQNFSNSVANARLNSSSEWKHIFPDRITIQFQRLETGEETFVEIDPNDFSQPYQLQLPQGEYAFSSRVEGGLMEDFLPIEINGSFVLGSGPQELELEGFTDYGLITVGAEQVENVRITVQGETKELPLNSNRQLYFQYISSSEPATIEVTGKDSQNTYSDELNVEERNHYHFVLAYNDAGNANVVELLIREFDYDYYFGTVDVPFNSIIRDIEGNVYKVVKIGNQTWMAENLRTTKFCNGDELRKKDRMPDRGPDEPFIRRDHSQPAYFHVDYNPAYDATFGLLYNQQTVQDDRNICPCDWELPSTEDWLELRDYLGGAEQASLRMRSPDPNFWIFPNFFDPSDVSDFNALGAGIFADTRDPFYQDGFYHTLESASWWTTEQDTSILIGVFGSTDRNFWIAGVSDGDEHFYRSIRCIKKN